MDIRFDTYYDNEALVERLQWLAGQHPDLAEVTVLGRSYEGREIPLVVLGNRATGPDLEKPGLWIDGNIHATEVTASMAALYIVRHLLAGYDRDPQITRILDQVAIYVVPRLNPDGAALALAASPRLLRSGTRRYPYQDKQDGLHVEDIDGDGRILQMRLPDPAGDWKASERDPRLMIKRRPDEAGGTYYRILPEGAIQNYDGHLISLARPLQGLDFNRNFPGRWRPEGEQSGAGDFPGSEPEIRAVMDFFATHPNIFGALTFHTFSRAILRPFSDKSDEQMDVHDRWVYEAIGERGTELTGYPCVSVYHDFRYHPKEVITGVFDDWLYEHRGIFAYTVELWDLPAAAGVEERQKEKRFIEWFRKHPEEDDYKILDFVNAQTPDSLVEWREYDHPQLGTVELGGWNRLYAWTNPPPALLEAEIAPQAQFAVAFATLAPRLAWRATEVTPIGQDVFHLLVVVENQGFLPTYGSNQAQKAQAVRPVRIELELPEGASLRSGKPKQELSHLEGRSNRLGVTWGSSPSDNRAKAEWLIHAPGGGTLTLQAIAERAGTLHQTLELNPG
jgi:murein tripeptide amidase MpaA